MKYILLLILTLPLFSQSVDNSKSTSTDNVDNPTKTIEPDKETAQTNSEPMDNTNLTQAEIRKNRKLEIGLGYGEGNQNLSPTRHFMNFSIEYNLTSRFSLGYTHLHRQNFSTSPYINPYGYFGVLEKTNSLEVGLFNFRYYLFEKFPLYITGGMGRDYLSREKSTEYQYVYRYQDGTYLYSPVIRDRSTLPANYRFFGFGFQWTFQNGFFIGVEKLLLQTRYTNRGNFLILDKSYTTDGVLFETIKNSDYQEKIKREFSNIRLGYSLQF